MPKPVFQTSMDAATVWIDLLLIPMGMLAGFFLKRGDLPTRRDKFVYFAFSGGMAYYCPPVVMDFFPVLSSNGHGFLVFVCAVFGGLILLNLWNVLPLIVRQLIGRNGQ